ncbi:NTP transferase domain-containing protein [Streptomyces sp. NPDC057702]|uniref:NTP transferase domain-containing protein n=1 Tax=unclassified Streptomyces TaxID=2593676 RepID=UPI0036AAEB1B
MTYDAVVLAGGAARRLGGADKPSLSVGGRSLLDRVLGACGDAGRTVVVGPRRPTVRSVRWVREDPPGGGPVAGLAAGLRETTAEVVLVLSADLPFMTRETVGALLAIPPGDEGAQLVDARGREQPLAAAYRAEPLRRELGLLYAEHGRLSGLPLRLLTGELRLRGLPQYADAAFDCDTWDAVGAARARIREHGRVLDEWIDTVKAELGIDLDVDTAALLDLARDAAHGVARPAAPLTTFLVGYAAGRAADGGPDAVAEATRKAVALAARWARESAEGGTGTAATEDTEPGPVVPGAGGPEGPGATGAPERSAE